MNDETTNRLSEEEQRSLGLYETDDLLDEIAAERDAAKLKLYDATRAIHEGVTVLIDACDTEDEMWSARATGQDTEEAEASGYMAGYRDGLSAVQELIGHDNPKPLLDYVEQLRGEVPEWREEAREWLKKDNAEGY